MPLRVFINETEKWIFPNKDWKEIPLETKIKSLVIDANFHIIAEQLENK